MTKPSFVSGSTRRRSNSSSGDKSTPTSATPGGGGGSSSNNANTPTSADTRGPRRSNRETPTSRAKRRNRGLPLTRSKKDSPETPSSTRAELASSPTPLDSASKPHNIQTGEKPVKLSAEDYHTPSRSSREDRTRDDTSPRGQGDVKGTPNPPSQKKQKKDKGNSSKMLHLSRPQNLVAFGKDGNEMSIRIVVNSQPFVNQSHSVRSNQSKKSKGGDSPKPSFLGHDGNLFYCHSCQGFGDVVCCDGCPRVYHPKCIPKSDPSRQALDADEDPWYCPNCYQDRKHEVIGFSATDTRSANGERRTVKRRCCECHQSGGVTMEQCEVCGAYLHYPSCRDSAVAAPEGPVLCSTCRSAEALTQEEEELQNEKSKRKANEGSVVPLKVPSDSTAKESSEKGKGKGKRRKAKSRHQQGTGDDDDTLDEKSKSSDRSLADNNAIDDDNRSHHSSMDVDHEEDIDSVISKSKKRKRPSITASSDSVTKVAKSELSPQGKKKSDKEKKKKKKKKAKRAEDGPTNDKSNNIDKDATIDTVDPEEEISPYQQFPLSEGLPKAIPGFFYFLGENRLKIERTLARKHRYFNRLPKGVERNEIVAKEAALWWVQLRPIEMRRYMCLSMRDYEQRIIEWKEEKNIREMLETDADEGRSVVDDSDPSPDDDLWTYMNHERLYLGTTVGSKPFKPEPGESHNTVLLSLLQDMRFHPVPMFSANRTEAEYGQMDFSRITIPFFDVHGPVSTSVGDECLGCTRGWTHFCNVLKRRVPAVEHRARLQPPLSSLMATRVGLGLRPRGVTISKEDENVPDGKNVELFSERETSDTNMSKTLPIVPTDSLSDPTSRADDIVRFIEEAVAMKVPEPPRPNHPAKTQVDTTKKPVLGRGALPTSARKRDSISSDSGDSTKPTFYNKCGRCRTVIQTDTGCIQCRRAQLVINMSKRPSKDNPSGSSSSNNNSSSSGNNNTNSSNNNKGSKQSDGKPNKPLLKVQTYMLGRVTMKEGSGEVQSEGDLAVSNGILRQRWTPYAILPPKTIVAPSEERRSVSRTNQNGDDDNDDDDVNNDEEIEEPYSDDNEEQASDATGEGSAADESSISVLSDTNDDNNRKTSSSGHPRKRNATPIGDTSELRPTSKRLRSARIEAAAAAAMTGGIDTTDESDRQKLAERHQIEANELHRKCLSVACCGILLALMRRDPLLLFASPVTAEGYSVIVKNPIDFGKIRANVLAGKYSTLGSFVSDAKLLCTNALEYNPPGSIYWKTAKELFDVLAVMQKRASRWMSAIKDAHAFAWRRNPRVRLASSVAAAAIPKDDDDNNTVDSFGDDPFEQLRGTWPEAVEMLENSDWLRKSITADFMRTKENETAFYGSLAVRRAAVAAEAALAPYPDSTGIYSTISRRTHLEDENLRRMINERVAQVIDPVELKDLPTWREESIVRVMRRAQSRRLDGRIGSENGCARCDGVRVDQELKMAMKAETVRWGRSRRKGDEVPRVAASRIDLSTGLASQNVRERIAKDRAEKDKNDNNKFNNDSDDDDAVVGGDENNKNVDTKKNDNGDNNDNSTNKQQQRHDKYDKVGNVAVSVRGSRIHGWGLFADQPFKKGDVVAEYLGEYVSLAVTEAREKVYQEQRIQDYQFRLDDSLVIDATMRGGHGRYINHNCNPNCLAKTIPGKPPNEHLKRVVIIAQRDIEPREELTYDYQFPLELDLDARIPCNCQSEQCRGFMNWDLPEKGSNNRVLRSHKRGANMRDRIRRLGRPLKSDK